MIEVSTIPQLVELPKNAVLKYPCHSDDYGEVIPADILLKLINKYPDGFDEDKVLNDYNNEDIEITNIINQFNEFANKFNCEFNLNYFVPCVNVYDDIIDYGDTEKDQNIAQIKFKKFIESKGYELYYVPYGGMNNKHKIRHWWSFD